jgi:hypothetical protein
VSSGKPSVPAASSSCVSSTTITVTVPYPTGPAGKPSTPAGAYPTAPAPYPSGKPSGSAPYPIVPVGTGVVPSVPAGTGYPTKTG